MKKLTVLALALAISGGFAFAKIAYQGNSLVHAANTDQNVQPVASFDEAEAFGGVADELLVAQLNQEAEAKLQTMISELDVEIENKLNSYFN